MKKRKLRIVIVFLLLGIAGCHQKSPTEEMADKSTARLTSTNKLATVPRQLINQIEQSYIEAYRKAKPESKETDGEIIANIPRRSLDMHISLATPSSGVLESNAGFEVGRGGGRLDLADWVTGVRGDFYFSVRIKFEPAMLAQQLKVYYISHSPKIKIEDQTWGMGCGKLADISNFYHSQWSLSGWRLNSTGQRYLYAASGVYLFVYLKDDLLYLTSLSVLDSRYREALCPESNS
ncbi:MAG: hypothetical protein KDD35_03170 [Bdellovibrionales bacterium]|nr:hypothetical protein [Bdellovibrionales bacterium]